MATDALKDIKEENYENIETIFYNMDENLKSTSATVRLKKAKMTIIEIFGFIKVLKGFI